jgi:hypothetical protein
MEKLVKIVFIRIDKINPDLFSSTEEIDPILNSTPRSFISHFNDIIGFYKQMPSAVASIGNDLIKMSRAINIELNKRILKFLMRDKPKLEKQLKDPKEVARLRKIDQETINFKKN